MATLSMTLSPNPVVAGGQVTATYSITGADDVPATSRVINVDGTATVDGLQVDATASVTLTVPAVTFNKQYQAPTAPGMTFSPTADPRVWTATAPSA